MLIKEKIKKIPFIKEFLESLNDSFIRHKFVKEEITKIKQGENILDAGCGSQYYKKHCSHLHYKSQDFGEYSVDQKKGFAFQAGVYKYGKLDYIGNIWQIQVEDKSFDNIICTEVFEHIPYPIQTVKEFSRIIKSGGKLILTAPSNSLRHMDPYYVYAGFSDRWFEKILHDFDFEIIKIEPVGDYFSWLKIEMYRTMRNHSLFSKLLLLPAFLFLCFKKKTDVSINTLCMGYHVIAKKK